MARLGKAVAGRAIKAAEAKRVRLTENLISPICHAEPDRNGSKVERRMGRGRGRGRRRGRGRGGGAGKRGGEGRSREGLDKGREKTTKQRHERTSLYASVSMPNGQGVSVASFASFVEVYTGVQAAQ